ncbi:nucleotide sugar transaminase [Pseudomonas aeruginosa]|nr:nucleotide sugar transaminase [Pseudomonas aeruginosa]
MEVDFPLSRDELYQRLRDRDVLVRRYFYPLISDFPMYHSLPSAAPANLPVARSISSRVLCLPIYPGLAAADVEFVAGLIASAAMRGGEHQVEPVATDNRMNNRLHSGRQ